MFSWYRYSRSKKHIGNFDVTHTKVYNCLWKQYWNIHLVLAEATKFEKNSLIIPLYPKLHIFICKIVFWPCSTICFFPSTPTDINNIGSEEWCLQPKVEQNTHCNLSSRDFWKGGEIKWEEDDEDPVNQLTSDRNGDQKLRTKVQSCYKFILHADLLWGFFLLKKRHTIN